MKTVAVLCWAGHKNFGDDLILEGLKQLFKDWEVVVFSNNSKGFYPAINFKQVNKCDLFVLGGGELIMQNCLFSQMPNVFDKSHLFSSAYRHIFSDKEWIKKVKITKIILGCGVDAENASELSPVVVDSLAQFDYIGLRDNASVNILAKFLDLKNKVNLFHDLAFAVNTNGFNFHKSDYAVVAPTDRIGLKVIGSSSTWLKENLKKYKQVKFVPFGSEDNNDYQTCKMLKFFACNSLHQTKIFGNGEVTLYSTLKLFAEAREVFAYRLHALILAHLLGVKYQFYPYHRKLSRVYDTVKNLDVLDIKQQQRGVLDEILEKYKN